MGSKLGEGVFSFSAGLGPVYGLGLVVRWGVLKTPQPPLSEIIIFLVIPHNV